MNPGKKAFIYLKVRFKLLRDMYAGCPDRPSILDEHILKKAKKQIKELHKLQGKVTKALEKFQGVEISESKELQELQGVARRIQEVLGRKEELPNDREELMTYCTELEQEYEDLLSKGEEKRATVFMRAPDGKIMLSTHIIVGNLFENLKIVTNNTTEGKENKIAPSKVSVGEMAALDIKPVEEFMFPDQDIFRNEDNSPKIFERPIRFERMGKQEVAIAASEVLPAGAEFECHLRVRADSPLAANDCAGLNYLLDLGKSNGFGQWRGKGGKGQFCYQIAYTDDNPTKIPSGWR